MYTYILYIYIYIYMYMLPFQHTVYIYGKTELTENGNFRLLTVNRKRKRQTAVCFLQTGKGKRKFVFLGRPKING